VLLLYIYTFDSSERIAVNKGGLDGHYAIPDEDVSAPLLVSCVQRNNIIICQCTGNSDINDASKSNGKFNENIKIIQEYKMSPCLDNKYVNNLNKCNCDEDYDLQRNEKLLNKRIMHVKYDNNNIVYVKSTHKQNDIRKESIKDLNNNNKENKRNKSKDIVLKTKNKKEANIHNNNRIYFNNKKVKSIKHKHKISQINNKNFDLLFSDHNNNCSPIKSSNHHHSNSEPIMFPNPNNKNFELLFSNNTINEPTKDRFSCVNCEPIYRLCIINNIPLKTFQCLICGNIINKNNLNLYIKKYHKQISIETSDDLRNLHNIK
jgi:hypothetical protein